MCYTAESVSITSGNPLLISYSITESPLFQGFIRIRIICPARHSETSPSIAKGGTAHPAAYVSRITVCFPNIHGTIVDFIFHVQENLPCLFGKFGIMRMKPDEYVRVKQNFHRYPSNISSTSLSKAFISSKQSSGNELSFCCRTASGTLNLHLGTLYHSFVLCLQIAKQVQNCRLSGILQGSDDIPYSLWLLS